jgi:hypothetical protein
MREIAYMKMQLSNDARSGAGSMVPGNGDKTGTYSATNNWNPVYKMDFQIYAPDVNTIQATAPKPSQQDEMQIVLQPGTPSPAFFQAMVSKKGIWNVEFQITKSSGTEAEVVALKLVGTNGIITRYKQTTDVVRGLDHQGKFMEHIVQLEHIWLVCTAWTLENFKILSTDKTTAAAYDFREPNKGKTS